MADIPSRLDLFALGRDYFVQRATKIDPGQVDVEGSNANLIVGSASVLGALLVRQLLYRTGALLLDGAEEEDLDRLAWDRYQELRKGASAAVVPVLASRPSALVGAGSIPAGTALRTKTGVEYTTTTPMTFGAFDLVSTQGEARAAQAGKATQVTEGAIVGFSSPGSLFDSSLTITNPESAAGGEDAEEDEPFRARLRDFWRTSRRGVIGAIEYGALTVPGVVSAQATEALSGEGLPARIVTLAIADSSGVANSALANKVRVILNEYRAAGIGVVITTSVPQLVDVTLRLTFRAGVDTVALTDNVRGAVLEFVNSLAVNSTLYLAELYSVLQRYVEDGLIVDQGSVIAPAGDVVPDVGKTLRTTLALITVS